MIVDPQTIAAVVDDERVIFEFDLMEHGIVKTRTLPNDRAKPNDAMLNLKMAADTLHDPHKPNSNSSLRIARDRPMAKFWNLPVGIFKLNANGAAFE